MTILELIRKNVQEKYAVWGIPVGIAIAIAGASFGFGKQWNERKVDNAQADLNICSDSVTKLRVTGGVVLPLKPDTLRVPVTTLVPSATHCSRLEDELRLVRTSLQVTATNLQRAKDSVVKVTSLLILQKDSNVRTAAITTRIEELERQRLQLADRERRLVDEREDAAENSAESGTMCKLLKAKGAHPDYLDPPCSSFARDSVRINGLNDQLNVTRERIKNIMSELAKLHSSL